jgi:hypothetical protein
MLRNLHEREYLPEVKVKNICGNPLFRSGVEYSAPARGTWTIAHLSMLIPHSHQIFVGAGGCIRGVALSAEESGGLDRFSMITVRENDVLEGDMERLFIDGVTDILNKLPRLPPAVLVYTSCIHHFLACDLTLVYRELRSRFPQIDFIDCYMNPTMRKSKMTPDENMRKQLYAALEPCGKNLQSVNIIGNCYARGPQTELVRWLEAGGYTVRDICRCTDYRQYKQMAESCANIFTIPAARAGAEALQNRLGQEALYLPMSFTIEEIERNLTILADRFGLGTISSGTGTSAFRKLETQAEEALARTHRIIGDMPVAIDYTATNRPLGLAALLLSHGFNVIRVYTDALLPGEESALRWLQDYTPELPVHATINFRCRTVSRSEAAEYGGQLLAIGQKAAYFTGTSRFVNLIENGDLYGFDGICRLAGMMADAAETERDMKSIIQIKAWGCCA